MAVPFKEMDKFIKYLKDIESRLKKVNSPLSTFSSTLGSLNINNLNVSVAQQTTQPQTAQDPFSTVEAAGAMLLATGKWKDAVKMLGKIRITPAQAAVYAAWKTISLGKEGTTDAMNTKEWTLAIELALKRELGKETAAEISKEFVGRLIRNADYNHFERPEVLEAGLMAVQISSGDVDMAERYVKTAQDLASSKPGVDLMEAMQAISDLTIQKDPDQLGKFGYSVPTEILEQSSESIEVLFDNMAETFAGSTEKMNNSSIHLWKTFKQRLAGRIEDMAGGIEKTITRALQILNGVPSGSGTPSEAHLYRFTNTFNPIYGSVITDPDAPMPQVFDGPVNYLYRSGAASKKDGGLSYVPYNGYVASLHLGERILTAEENRAYTNGLFGGTQIAKLADTIVIREEADIDRFARRLAKEINLAAGAGA